MNGFDCIDPLRDPLAVPVSGHFSGRLPDGLGQATLQITCASRKDRYAEFINHVNTSNFGILIAFVLPGSLMLWGVEPYSLTLQSWLGQPADKALTVAGFLFVTVVSIWLGMLASTVRWLVIDFILHKWFVRKPTWNFRRLRDSVAAFERLIEIHYRFYQWAANSVVALTVCALLRWYAAGFNFSQLVMLVVMNLILFLGARDSLEKYYQRGEALLFNVDVYSGASR